MRMKEPHSIYTIKMNYPSYEFHPAWELSLSFIGQGSLESVVSLTVLELSVPDYSTMSRRHTGLMMSLPAGPSSGAPHVVVDSTGLKVCRAGG